MKTKNTILATMICLGSLSAFGWGQKGHDTTVFIAENHLTPTAKAQVEKLLDGKSMVYYANWLDNASHTPEYAYSKTWHYKNIDDGITFENAPLLDTGDIVRAVSEQAGVLQDPNASDEQKQLALKMVIHFLGDIHQPMHMGHASDIGGNRWMVKYFNRDTNLHSLWDTTLPEAAHNWSYSEWQQQLDRLPADAVEEIISEGNPTKWGKETFELGTRVYQNTPEGTKISYDYIADWTPIVEMQFLRGGLRLADLLNSLFDPSYTPRNTIVSRP